jgi:uncharacterized protein YkwD
MSDRIPAGEMQDVTGILHTDIKELFPEAVQAQKSQTIKGLKQSTWLIAAALLLSGCEAVNDLTSRLPQTSLPQISASPDPSAKPAQSTAPKRPAQSGTTAQMEAQVRQQINTIRQQQGLSTLRQNPDLDRVAREYSRRMAEQNFFSHTSPAGDDMVQRVKSAGVRYSALGENLFKSTNVAQPVPITVEGWMESPGHRKNILGADYRETGIGVWRTGETYYFTQLFMRSP